MSAPLNQCCDCCGKDTRFGTGLFVNRIPADVGFICPFCARLECDRCDQFIDLDEDVTACDVHDLHHEFSDGAYRVHFDCLTKSEQKKYWGLWSS